MMAPGRSPRSSKLSTIRYRYSPLEGPSFEVVDFDHVNDVAVPSRGVKHDNVNSEPKPKSHEIISTSELMSTVCQLWNQASRPFAFFHPKKNSSYYNIDLYETNAYCYSVGDGNDCSTSGGTCMLDGHHLNFAKLPRKIKYGRSYVHSLFWSHMQGNPIMFGELWKDNLPEVVAVLYDWRKLLKLSSEASLRRFEHQEDCAGNDFTPAKEIFGIGDHHNEVYEKMESSLVQRDISITRTSNATSLSSDYLLKPDQVAKTDNDLSSNSASILQTDYYIENALGSHVCREHENLEKGDKKTEIRISNEPTIESSNPSYGKQLCSVANQQHAFAGALAGVFVSLFLHPMDTVKTVIQSCRADGKSTCYICRSIIMERGVRGLYRGIGSNITSSAPISAVYTFTYESVKAALFPLLPNEYQSLAHCSAGGCASIATSFIFTPSERIKQQMQIGSHYQTCWSAFMGIIKNGGVSSLFAGWGAVLCRNVPHSVIKFYTYESFKAALLSTENSNAQPSTLQTLICGGLAGSTAALFTTPFDVVKTRLQTQEEQFSILVCLIL
ncbi:adenine nucleotide transporter BT1, chloroplastic/mitochondrial isoform X2 [Impatiens glandulifera]|uniref:adenine nucleotide transporter BT1, chloroplastic/mitochondrial isoform X2 n=1 Tax=Impatiens glandulifera TaxID=253017 RepID=UPI001FB116A5|nr:adenine nucleotide transporter BT1, chloroplastic/mitochondrial isoform X2 [Impatiens glandulifera]